MKIIKKTTLAAVMMVSIMLSAIGVAGCDPYFKNTIYECEYDLIAGQDTDVGKIVIWDERDTDGVHDLYIKFVIEEPCWYLLEASFEIAVQIGTGHDWDDYNWDDAVTKKGSPKVGKFTWNKDDFNMDTSWEYGPIDISTISGGVNLDCGDLAIVAHAVVFKKCGDIITEEQTAWGEGKPFGSSWAMFMLFPCCKTPDYYGTPDIHTTLKWQGGPGYWEFTMSGIPEDEQTLYMSNGDTFVAWCFEVGINMNQNADYNDVTLISSLDADSYDRYDDIPWDKINYLINHKGSYSNTEIQKAIWWFAGESGGENNDAVKEAIALGVGYVPQTSGWIAIIVEISPNVQGTFIEMDP